MNGTFRSYFGAICVPILDKGDGTISNVTHDWSNAMAGLGGGLAVTVMRLEIRNHRVDIAKERLAELAISNGCQWALFVDDDVIPPGNGLFKMIKLWRSDPKYKIISGVYYSKSDPALPLVFRGNLQGSYWDWTVHDLIKADGAGAGFLFVDLEMLKKLPKPWFSCDYVFEDPRSMYDIQKWNKMDELGNELLKGKEADTKTVVRMEGELKELGDKIQRVQRGEFDPNLLKNVHNDAGTTEDLYFFKKAKEHGYDLWVDCSIQCMHQDKRTGRVWGISPDDAQAQPRWSKRMTPGEMVVLDIGAGEGGYHIPEGNPIRIDLDERTKPDIVADARQIPLEDCYADMVFSSHLLEHFSFRESVSVLREWVRLLKVDGKLVIIVPNLKWASKVIMEPEKHNTQYHAERAMYMYFSQQDGTLVDAYEDTHKAGFTPESLAGLLSRVGGLTDIEVHTTEGVYSGWDAPENLVKDGTGYNIIAIAKKAKHNSAISLKLPIGLQEEAKKFVGEKARQYNKKNNVEKEAEKIYNEAELLVKKAKKEGQRVVTSIKKLKVKK